MKKSEIDISILFFTRGRIAHHVGDGTTNMVKDMIQNINEKSACRSAIEVIIGYDFDDYETKEYLEEKKYLPELNDRFGDDLVNIHAYELPAGDGKGSGGEWYLFLGNKSSSNKWIWLTADDFRIITDDWDVRLRENVPDKRSIISQGMIHNIPGYWGNGRQDLNSYLPISPILTADVFHATKDIVFAPVDQWYWQLSTRLGILKTMDYIIDCEHLEWGIRISGTLSFTKKGTRTCSTSLSVNTRLPEWESSLLAAEKRIGQQA